MGGKGLDGSKIMARVKRVYEPVEVPSRLVSKDSVAVDVERIFSADYGFWELDAFTQYDRPSDKATDNLKVAEELLAKEHVTDTDLRHVCLAINRSLDFRAKSLRSALSLKMLDDLIRHREGVLDGWDLLDAVGLVRPIMLKKIKAIRNSIEHEWLDAPSLDTCEEFAEFAFYFLRATSIYIMKHEVVLLCEAPGSPKISIETKPEERWRSVVGLIADDIDDFREPNLSTSQKNVITLKNFRLLKSVVGSKSPQYELVGTWDPRPDVVLDLLFPWYMHWVHGFG